MPRGCGWTPIATRVEASVLKADFTSWFVAQNDAHYAFTLRVRSAEPLQGAVKDAKVATLFQFAPRALPQVKPGTTTFEITVSSVEGLFSPKWKGVEVIHEWDQPREAATK